MEIKYAGKISRNDYLRSIQISDPKLKRNKWILGSTLFLLIFCNIYLFFDIPTESADLRKYSISYGWVILIFLTYPWWFPYLQLSTYNRPGNIYRNNINGVINDNEVSINTTDIKAAFQWSAYIDFKQDKDLFLLYQGRNAFQIYKREMFSTQDDWESFISIAKDKIGVNIKHTQTPRT